MSAYIVLPIVNTLIPVIHVPDILEGVKIASAKFHAHKNYVYATFSPVTESDAWATQVRQTLHGGPEDHEHNVQPIIITE